MNNNPDYPSIQESLHMISSHLLELNEIIAKELDRQKEEKQRKSDLFNALYDGALLEKEKEK